VRLERCTRSQSRALHYVRCICHGLPHHIEDTYADLDGVPFRDYYCVAAISTLPDGTLTAERRLLQDHRSLTHDT